MKFTIDWLQEHLDTTGSYVAFMPNDGPQTDFLAASALSCICFVNLFISASFSSGVIYSPIILNNVDSKVSYI